MGSGITNGNQQKEVEIKQQQKLVPLAGQTMFFKAEIQQMKFRQEKDGFRVKTNETIHALKEAITKLRSDKLLDSSEIGVNDWIKQSWAKNKKPKIQKIFSCKNRSVTEIEEPYIKKAPTRVKKCKEDKYLMRNHFHSQHQFLNYELSNKKTKHVHHRSEVDIQILK